LPESNIYSKSRVLYGFYEGLENIRKKREAIVLEGYIDVIVAHQNGLTNSVSCLGVALSEMHISFLKKYVDRLALIFDSDEAGAKAAIKASEHLINIELEHYIVTLPLSCDPDEYIIKNGASAFIQYIKTNKKTFFEYYADYTIALYGASTAKQKLKILREIFPFVLKIKSFVIVQDILNMISQKLNLNLAVVAAEYRNFAMGKSILKTSSVELSSVEVLGRNELVLYLVSHYPEYATKFTKEMFTDKRCGEFWFAICEYIQKNGGNFDLKEFINEISLEDEKQWYIELVMRDIAMDPADCAEKLFSEMHLASLRLKHKALERELKECINSGEKIDTKKIEEFTNLSRLINYSVTTKY
jgi:DNA primase